MSLAGPGIIDCWGYRTHCHFGWTEGNPIIYLFRSLLFLKEGTVPSHASCCGGRTRPVEASRCTRRGGLWSGLALAGIGVVIAALKEIFIH
jgi:hypothetical protein